MLNCFLNFASDDIARCGRPYINAQVGEHFWYGGIIADMVRTKMAKSHSSGIVRNPAPQ